jgi:hypothetical protein
MKILWNIVLVVLAFMAGACVMMPIEAINGIFYPLPEGTKVGTPEFVKFVAGLPTQAFILVWLSHFSGPLLATFVASRFAAYRSLIPAYVVGFLYLLAGITNLILVGHTPLFALIDLALYPLATAIGIYVGRQKPAPAIAANTP